jgi:DNA topoisomerase-2
LVINFIHCYWPALLQKHDFLREFVTPLVKATKGRHAVAFFTMNEYLAWRDEQGAAAAGYTIK